MEVTTGTVSITWYRREARPCGVLRINVHGSPTAEDINCAFCESRAVLRRRENLQNRIAIVVVNKGGCWLATPSIVMAVVGNLLEMKDSIIKRVEETIVIVSGIHKVTKTMLDMFLRVYKTIRPFTISDCEKDEAKFIETWLGKEARREICGC